MCVTETRETQETVELLRRKPIFINHSTLSMRKSYQKWIRCTAGRVGMQQNLKKQTYNRLKSLSTLEVLQKPKNRITIETLGSSASTLKFWRRPKESSGKRNIRISTISFQKNLLLILDISILNMHKSWSKNVVIKCSLYSTKGQSDRSSLSPKLDIYNY